MSLQDDSTRLRTIAGSVMRGDCPREDYLAERRRLLELHAGKAPLRPRCDPPGGVAGPPLEPHLQTQPVAPVSLQISEAETAVEGELADRSQSMRDLLIGIGTVALVLALLGGLLAWVW